MGKMNEFLHLWGHPLCCAFFEDQMGIKMTSDPYWVSRMQQASCSMRFTCIGPPPILRTLSPKCDRKSEQRHYVSKTPGKALEGNRLYVRESEGIG